MAIPLTSTIQITIRGQMTGQSMFNVLHYRPASLGPGFTSTLTAALNTFRTSWRAAVLPHVSVHYAAVEYHAVEIKGAMIDPNDPEKGKLVYGEEATLAGIAVTDQGALAGDPHPTYVAATIQKRTGLAGRHNKGSFRLGGLVELDTEAAQPNTLTAACRNRLANVVAAIRTNLTMTVPGETLEPVVFSRSLMIDPPAVWNTTVHARQLIVETILNTFVGSQVSRKQRATMGA